MICGRKILAAFLAVQMLIQPALVCKADDKRQSWLQSRLFGRQQEGMETSVEKLARCIDHLEEELQEDGTVVAKAPDVWGEARLTTHRAEFEQQLKQKVDDFEVRVNAAVSRSDQAFLASALALSALPPTKSADGSLQPTSPSWTQINQMLPGLAPRDGNEASGSASTPNTMTVYNTPPGKLMESTNSKFGSEYGDIKLEQTLELDQMARYLNHLHELRRLNEGDDTADSPGYSLNLVRIPISIMPGSRTRAGHAAEVTITAEPVITEQLLPVTFRTLVINDLVDQLSARIVMEMKSREIQESKLLDFYGNLKNVIDNVANENGNSDLTSNFTFDVFKRIIARIKSKYTQNEISLQITRVQSEFRSLITKQKKGQNFSTEILNLTVLLFPLANEIMSEIPEFNNDSIKEFWLSNAKHNQLEPNLIESLTNSFVTEMRVSAENTDMRAYAEAATRTLYELPTYKDIIAEIDPSKLQPVILSANEALIHTRTPSSSHRRARSPFSGDNFKYLIPEDFETIIDRVSDEIGAGNHNAASSVRNLLRDELENAYEMVFERSRLEYISSRLDLRAVADSLRTGKECSSFRQQFLSGLDDHSATPRLLRRLLAWPVLAESLLLNEQLNADIRHVSQNPECKCISTVEKLDFYGLNPDPVASLAFTEYVKCRWPIHVFALDPMTQDQNVTDQYALRREMQLAMAVALANGTVSAQTATRYARRLEMDLETVSLNRTVVAFGHGRDTFGWRFSPRVQTPDVESNATVLFRDLLIGGPNRDQLKKQWQLEPGMRECLAVVLMPSFITHVRFDSRGQFIPLVCSKLGTKTPADTRTSISDTVDLSRRVREMQDFASCAMTESHLYRDGEVDRLMRRVEQLSDRLPLQTTFSQVPNENTLGGFEMFSSGVTDLAPELHDWFGEPGFVQGEESTVFLIGSNFSMTGTRVIAGNRVVKHTLLSREVMEITIPRDVQIDSVADKHVIDVHVATPYGVSQHLDIPVDKCDVTGSPDKPEGLAWLPQEKRVVWISRKTTVNSVDSWAVEDAGIMRSEPDLLEITVPASVRAAGPIPSTAAISLFVSFDWNGARYVLLPSSITELKYAVSRNSFVIDGANMQTLQKSIKEQLVSKLKELGHLNTPPTEPVSVFISGFVTPTGATNPRIEIPGEVKLTVTIQAP